MNVFTMSLWRVDVYYSGFTTVEVEAPDEHGAIIRGREEAVRRLQQAIIMDPNGTAVQLIQSLEPWEACDTAERVG